MPSIADILTAAQNGVSAVNNLTQLLTQATVNSSSLRVQIAGVSTTTGSTTTGTVTQVNTGTGLTGGPITSVGTISLSSQFIARDYIAGLILSSSGGTGTFAVSAGQAVDSTNSIFMGLSAALSKTTSSFAAGSSNGSLDTGTISSSTWYHDFLIASAGSSLVDVLTSLSASAPSLPTNYTLFRRIGSMRTDSASHWNGFVQNNNLFEWITPVTDVSTNPTSAAVVARTLTVPPTILPVTLLAAQAAWSGATPADARFSIWPTNLNSPGSLYGGDDNAATVFIVGGQLQVRADASQQVNTQMSSSLASVLLTVKTLGWIDSRGTNA